MSDLHDLYLERSIEKTEAVVQGSDKGLKIFKSALFEVVAAVLLIALFFYENGTLTVKEQDLVVFFGNIAVMFILSMLFDNNYRIKGKLVGISTERYKNALESLSRIKRSLTDEDIKRLDEKIEDYRESELEKRRKSVLYKSGVTYVEYEAMRKMTASEMRKTGIDLKKRRAVKRALSMKKLDLSTAKLLSDAKDGELISIGKSGRELDKAHNIKTAITYLLSAAVFAYFAVGLSKDFNLAAFGWYMLKACFLIFRGIKSYFESFMEVTEKQTDGLESKKLLLDYFLSKPLQTTAPEK